MSANVSLKVENNVVRTTIEKFNPFNITLTPSGGMLAWVVSAVSGPLLEFVVNLLRPRIEDTLRKQSVELFTIPSNMQIPAGNHVINAKTKDVALGTRSGYAAFEGNIDFS